MISLTPKKIEEVPAALSAMTEKSKFVGGGTDFVIKLRMGRFHPDALCYLGHVQEYREIVMKGERLYVGGYATMTEIGQHPLVKEYFPALKDAADDIGSLQIRNNAVLAGNIGNVSPASDLIPVLYLYDADMLVLGPEGERIVPIREMIPGPGRLSSAYNEAITGVLLSKTDEKTGFLKLGSRSKVTIARLDIALALKMEERCIRDIRIYVGAIAITPLRFTEIEDYLRGKEPTEEHLLTASQYLSRYIEEHVPVQFDRDYKVQAAKGAVADIFERVLEREQGCGY